MLQYITVMSFTILRRLGYLLSEAIIYSRHLKEQDSCLSGVDHEESVFHRSDRGFLMLDEIVKKAIILEHVDQYQND